MSADNGHLPEGTTIATLEKRDLIDNPSSGPPPGSLSFVLIGNPNRPNGGFLARGPQGFTIPIIGATFSGPTPTNSGTTPENATYPTVDIAQQYDGSYDVGMIRGAYHFATPDTTSGAAQANYFVDHGGGWSKDGRTLPGALDIEWNPYGAACYGKTQSAMVSWISSFLAQYKARTGRDAVIYTATSWWVDCTGNYGGFASANPLWIARYASAPGTLPAGWSYYTMWQYTSSGPTVGDHDKFNGALDRVQALANG